MIVVGKFSLPFSVNVLSLHNSALKSSHWIIANKPLIIQSISEMALNADEPRPRQRLSEAQFLRLRQREGARSDLVHFRGGTERAVEQTDVTRMQRFI